MKKSLLLYIIVTTLFVFFIWFVIDNGKNLRPVSENGVTISTSSLSENSNSIERNSKVEIWNPFINNIKTSWGLFLLQIITILFCSKLFGYVFTKLGQPSVIGEMFAGIFLGPSILGLTFPEISNFLFPQSALSNLQFISQVGLTFFMFIVGMELDFDSLKNKARNAIVISHASIVFPYFLGVSVSYFLYEQFAPTSVSFLSFALFMGIAVSITAFPVLARILQERKLSKTPLGAMALTCAAIDDISAWFLLATVIAIIKAESLLAAFLSIAIALLFVLFMFYVARLWLKKLTTKYVKTGILNKSILIVIFLVLLLSAFTTEVIGIHSLFGAFIAGVVMPHDFKLRQLLAGKIEDLSVLLLLPIFFAFTGLRTQIGLLNDGNLWLVFIIILFVAVLGKLGGSVVSSKVVGYSWKDSLTIGTLMNTRGLMELIVLNIGYDLGILSPSIFAIMVLMALTTTFMTGPLLDFIEFFDRKKTAAIR